MTRRRWIADEVYGSRAALVGEHARHLALVLRARVGQEFDIVAGDRVREARISSIDDQRIEFDLGAELPTPAAPDLTVVISIFKFDRMEWAIEKCTELGVSRIVPLVARRSEKHLAASAGKRVERWRRIAAQAAEQSRRPSAPQIAEPIELKAAVALAGASRILLAESEQHVMLSDVVLAPQVVLAFGPEGGWTDGEINLFRDSGWTTASLGPTILRAETAAIAATAIVISEMA